MALRFCRIDRHYDLFEGHSAGRQETGAPHAAGENLSALGDIDLLTRYSGPFLKSDPALVCALRELSAAVSISQNVGSLNMTKPLKLTVVLEPPTRNELVEWACEERRPLGNLMRHLLAQACEQRRQRQQQAA